MVGEEKALKTGLPISDIGLFSASISNTGALSGIPKRSSLGSYKGRVHLVLAEGSNYALTHFILSKDYPMRLKLLEDLQKAAEPFDGVQVDFEAVRSADKANFLSFLNSLKIRIGKKTLSVALPGRIRASEEAYDYAAVSAIADRVIVMAYDEHWSGSPPGPVASLEWCGQVAAYASKTIPAAKLVMGAPLYGRAWADASLSRAYRHSALDQLMRDKGILMAERVGEIPRFSYSQNVEVVVYYEDAQSMRARLRLYAGLKAPKVAFWRLGLEPSDIWEMLTISK